MRSVFTACVFTVVMSFATPALALMVTNLDSVQHELTIHENGTVRKIILQPNAHIRTITWYAEINIENSPRIRALHNEEYVIWPRGRLSIQRYHSKGCCVF